MQKILCFCTLKRKNFKAIKIKGISINYSHNSIIKNYDEDDDENENKMMMKSNNKILF